MTNPTANLSPKAAATIAKYSLSVCVQAHCLNAAGAEPREIIRATKVVKTVMGVQAAIRAGTEYMSQPEIVALKDVPATLADFINANTVVTGQPLAEALPKITAAPAPVAPIAKPAKVAKVRKDGTRKLTAQTPYGVASRQTARTYTHVVVSPVTTVGLHRKNLLNNIAYCVDAIKRADDATNTDWATARIERTQAELQSLIALDDSAPMPGWEPGCHGWCGRLDLAERVAEKARGYGAKGVVICPVDQA